MIVVMVDEEGNSGFGSLWHLMVAVDFIGGNNGQWQGGSKAVARRQGQIGGLRLNNQIEGTQ